MKLKCLFPFPCPLKIQENKDVYFINFNINACIFEIFESFILQQTKKNSVNVDIGNRNINTDLKFNISLHEKGRRIRK